MSKSYRIHGTRYLRKYSAAERSSIYAYMSDVRKIANSLCTVKWERASRDIAATTTIHTEEGIDWNEPERERFDAAEWCGEHADGFHRAFAQAACYVFELPQSAVGLSIERLGIQVTSDPYNPYGARISAMTSATLDIPMDCATVREGEVYRAPDEDGMGAAPRLFMRNADGSQNWYANTERVELEPDTPLTAKKYIFVFCCLENYNRGRDGWIEGSSYIDNDVELTLSAACADLVEGELNDLTASRGRTLIRSLNLLDGTVVERVIDGDVTSIVETGHSSGGVIQSGARIAGSFGNLGYAGLNGIAKIGVDLENISVQAQTDAPKVMTQDAADIFSVAGAKQVGNTSTVYSAIVPFKARATGLSGLLVNDRVKASLDGGPIDYQKTAVKCNFSISIPGCRGYEFYNDRIVITGSDDNPVKVDFSGTISSVHNGFLGLQSLIIAGQNTIGGNTSPVKVLFADGTVADFGIDLTPDDYNNFRANYIYGNISNLDLQRYDYKTISKEHIDIRKSDCIKTDDAFGSYDLTSSDSESAHTLAWPMPVGINFMLLCLTGNFSKIGGLSANGAAVVCCSLTDAQEDVKHYRINLVPFDVGKVKEGAFVQSETSGLHNGVGVSHLIYIPEE